MNTLEALRLGKLKGSKKLKLACGLKIFPKEIFDLSETLEILDLTDNALSDLPHDFHKLKKLKILFLSNNLFREVPSILAKCTNLTMIGIRNNQINVLKENVLPLNIRWLILTDNNLKKLPDSLGNLQYLQKCMLSGNRLESLPQSLSNCKNLELLRISSNKLTKLPIWLLQLPKLSWLAYSGNPFCAKHPSCDTPIDEVLWENLKIEEKLGEGASGEIYKAIWKDEEVALKIFKGSMTSDGLPQEEMDINISMGKHTHLIDVLARVTGHPEGRDVLMLELIPSKFYNLGLPPSLESCTRDIYPKDFELNIATSIKILVAMASAALHMHQRGIMHGDFYAHNILIDQEGHSILGDFGGASYYEPKEKEIRDALERLEVRAFGCLIEEFLLLSQKDTTLDTLKTKLEQIKDACLSNPNSRRPLFQSIYKDIHSLYTKSTLNFN